jgi:hypothetical protein
VTLDQYSLPTYGWAGGFVIGGICVRGYSVCPGLGSGLGFQNRTALFVIGRVEPMGTAPIAVANSMIQPSISYPTAFMGTDGL